MADIRTEDTFDTWLPRFAQVEMERVKSKVVSRGIGMTVAYVDTGVATEKESL